MPTPPRLQRDDERWAEWDRRDARGDFLLALIVVAVILAVGLALLSGCKLVDITSTGTGGSADQRQDGGSGCCDPTPAQPLPLDLRCEVVQPHRSSCVLEWDGGGTYDAVATRAQDGLADSRAQVRSGTEIDPGPPGAGAGTWTIRLLGPTGATLASVSVELDS